VQGSVPPRLRIAKLKKILLALNFIVAKVPAGNAFKSQIEDITIELYKYIKDISADPTVADILELQKGVEHLDVLTKTLVATGLVKGSLYTFVHRAAVSLFTILRADLAHQDKTDSGTHGSISSASAAHDVSLELVHILADTESDTSFPYTPHTRTYLSRPQTQHMPEQPPSQTFSSPVPSTSQRTGVPKNYTKVAQVSTRTLPTQKPNSSRTEGIYAFILKTGKVGVPQVSAAFPTVSSKTIQRELVALVGSGRIAKEGDRRWTIYSVPAGK
jgi:hypothetical protein